MSLVVTVFSQQSLDAQTPKKPPIVIIPLVRLEKGEVVANVYKNVTLGLELTPEQSLKLGDPELKGPQGANPQLVTVAAWGERSSLSARAGTVFYAEALARSPESLHSTEGYMHGVIRANGNDGFEVIKGPGEGQFGGLTFSKSDFRKGSVYEAVLVKACDAYALVFIFTGADAEAVDKLISQTKLKLDSEKSGCHNKSDASPLKN